ncbi:MAG TPA: hypothetical protein VFY36_12215 [Solirubrobacteraceae bacterium]|nr:hypothetical protein [Solirubrobacteraceae bacterium]
MTSATIDLPPVSRRAGASRSLRRALAMVLLPASILPVLLAGPALVRAPRTLWRQAWADVQRMQAGSAAHQHKAHAR